MITLYAKATSNGRKASIMLEETGLEYEVRPMALERKEQKEPWFLEINPNGRIPVITDDDGPGGQPVTVFESGAILMYLAEKSGRFLATETAVRARTLE
ncbi:MAG TPA: glutathione S-transferase N-terminal domain-containing protein, partial [Alphaproteobacteria bacterium]|nr:glutathione S-transferase N-terminal domain-containing protein [Alphaproteobacteria bacterium]